ncbi:DNA translocase FtsK [Deinococcus metallilatus]|uniref:DNA translocase FtsK n=1 Tax=Deinococcus metallilatus TaxID=1211322 RepID=A0AAJ5F432_9DEIO|nr:DNA translocase FtsK [Deinococcus metallilatus]MBB5295957.1 S-DNA-T family DNA segregation ATPase FtsK/SpoIIIE [Deinococcus metallilatus]QBY08215.1 DNA translocase FtsK [Deinococcus metallilatus]RXJ11946.1 DNA translocase FtsK [Deinococcus metallilatus]TLK25822.1 DNA translocase FtsK [Deinococcus metallilatus]
MAKARAKAAPPVNRFDGEALGLVLFALGIFLAVTLALPQFAEGGFMTQAHAALTGWLGWAAYLLPIIPVAYGVLVFLGRDLAGLTRRVLGGVLVVASLLALHEVLVPGAAGEGASRLMAPLTTTLGYAAALLPLVTLTLGLELMLRYSPLTLLKAFFRGLSVLLGGATSQVQSAIEARQDGRDSARARTPLRQSLMAQTRDLDLLRKLYPDARELKAQQGEVRAAQRELRSLDEGDLKGLERDLAGWQEVTKTFVGHAARDLREAVAAEAPGAGADAEATANEVRTGRHELRVELPSTLASGALERLRRGLVTDLQRLAQRAGKLERDRQAAEKALAKPDAGVLARELPAHRERQKAWQELAEDFTTWRGRERHYPGWPDLAAAFDRAPTELAAALAEALAGDPDGTLSTQEEWRARLDRAQKEALERAQAMAVHAQVSAPGGDPLPAPTLDFDFTAVDPQEAQEGRPEEPSPLPASTTVLTAVPPRPEVLLEPGGVQAQQDEEEEEGGAAPWESAQPERRRPAQGAVDIALPGYDLLDPVPAAALNTAQLDVAARQRAAVIDQTLRHFNLQAKVVDFARGPTVTRYEIEPAPGEKISRIASLSNDLARALAVGGVRVEAPVPGKSVIGLEVPNAEREPVTFHQAAAAPSFRSTRARLPIILGKSIDGELMVGDLAKMPHLLIAGSTGSGKSVCVNTLITSLLYRYLPTELRFLMVDPKMVELTPYDGIPHLVRPVVTNPMDAAGVLLGAVAHMERRYKMMSQVGAKNLEQFNAKMRQVGEDELPHLVIIIDELADLMITSPKEVESAIMRLAQMARATGMHLVLATQRPSVDILTSLIKVNVPARIAFAVSSSHDSRTILDSVGAERLTGMGDMLFYQPGLVKPVRLQGPYISEVESARITDELRRQVFDDAFGEAYGTDFDGTVEASGPSVDKGNMDFSDPHLRQAALICIEEGQGSVSRLQRRLSVGHARAGKLMDMLEAMGIVSKHQGSKPREVLITEADLPEYFGR